MCRTASPVRLKWGPTSSRVRGSPRWRPKRSPPGRTPSSKQPFRGSGKSQLSVVYNDASPGAAGDSVGVKQAHRHGVLVPHRAGADQAEAVGQFGTVTKRTVERCPEPVVAPPVLVDPRSEVEWRSVTDVLGVATGELGDPVALRVWVIASDGALHEPSVPGIRYRCSDDTHSQAGPDAARLCRLRSSP
jgi:hypothetical protein